MLPADQVEAFQGLVDEVEHVAAIGVDPLGPGHEQQLGQHRRRGTTGDRGEQGALRGVAMAHARPAPQPALQDRRVGGAGERGAVAAWCLAGAVASDAPRAVEQGEAGLLLRQLRQQVAESGEDRQADAPAVPILRAEQRDLAQHRRRWLALCRQASHRLGDDQIQIVGHAVREPAAPVTHRVGMVEHGLYPDVFPADLDRTGRHVVRPQVERAAAGQIEPGVMPMTGQDAVLDRPAIEREAHVRAAIVESADATLLADHEHRPVASPQHHAALGLQLGKRADANELVPCFDHGGPPLTGSASIAPESATSEGALGLEAIAVLAALLVRHPWDLGADRVADERWPCSARVMSGTSEPCLRARTSAAVLWILALRQRGEW